MAITVTCSCGKQLRAKEEAAGKRVKCPQCGNTVVIPVAEPEGHPSSPKPMPPVPRDNATRPPSVPIWLVASTLTLVLIVAVATFFLGTRIGRTGREQPLGSMNSGKSADLESIQALLKELRSENEKLKEQLGTNQASNASPPDSQVSNARPNLENPEEVLRGYFRAAYWQDRLLFVIDSPETRARMVKSYGNVKLNQLIKSLVIQPVKKDVPMGQEIIVQANVDGDPTNYYMVRTPEGYRIDWLKTMDEEKAKQLQSKLRDWGIEDAVLQVKVLGVKQTSKSYSGVNIDVTNMSKALLGFWQVDASLYDSRGTFLAVASVNGSNLKPGQSVVGEIIIRDVQADDIASWKLNLGRITLQKENGETFSGAEQYIQLKEVK